jgi:hypothetical protein
VFRGLAQQKSLQDSEGIPEGVFAFRAVRGGLPLPVGVRPPLPLKHNICGEIVKFQAGKRKDLLSAVSLTITKRRAFLSARRIVANL